MTTKSKARKRTMWSVTDADGYYLWPDLQRLKRDAIASFIKDDPDQWRRWEEKGYRAVKVHLSWEAR